MESSIGVHPLLEAVCPSHSGIAFSANGREYTLGQTMLWADWAGELEAFASDWQKAWWCQVQAEAKKLEPEAPVVEEFANDFRYDRDLTTAEECEQWLTSRGLDPEALESWALRQYWLSQLAGDDTLPRAQLGLDGPDSRRAFCTDLLLSDEFGLMARHLAWRVALSCEAVDPAGRRKPTTYSRPSWRPAVSRLLFQAGPDWYTELRDLEAGFRSRRRELLTLENRRVRLNTLRLRLTRVYLEILEVDTESAAREASLMVRQDGMNLRQVAMAGAYPCSRLSSLMEDLPLEWQQALGSAAPGNLLPPFERQGSYQLCLLKKKAEPALENAQVRQRVDAAILRQHFTELECRHVQWHMSLDLPEL